MAYVIGTFSAAPLTLACMAEFLEWVRTPKTIQLYAEATARTDAWVWSGVGFPGPPPRRAPCPPTHAPPQVHDVNQELAARDLPMRVDNLTTVWTAPRRAETAAASS